MSYLLVRHKVKEFQTWKTAYDQHREMRKSGGCMSEQLLRSKDDPNSVIALFEWDDLNKARKFASSDDLRQTMQRAGVLGQPEFFFLEEVERKSLGRSAEKGAA